MAQVQGARAINPSDKKRGSVNFSKDRENGISKIFVISLESTKGGRFQRKQTFEFGRPNSKLLPVKLINHSARTKGYNNFSHAKTIRLLAKIKRKLASVFAKAAVLSCKLFD